MYKQKKNSTSVCCYCYKEFLIHTYDKNRGQKYCSRSCHTSQRNKDAALSTQELFFKNISKEYHVDGCWVYKNTNQAGYGRITINQKDVLAHRYSYEINYGFISHDLCVCHKCDNPSCVNPDHLFLGTLKDNYDDMVSKGRRAPYQKGSGHWKSKLNEQQVLEIKEKLKNGEGVTQIGRDYNVAHTLISRIKNGTRWKHVSM